MWSCEACKKDINNDTKTSHIKPETPIEDEVISGMNNNFTYKTYTYLNPKSDQGDGLGDRTIDDCTKYFHRMDYKCVIVVEFIQETYGPTS